MQIPEEEWKSLSHRQRRVLVNKERRRRKRKTAALKREEDRAAVESQPGYVERLAAEEKLEDEIRQKEEAEREKKAQDVFRRKREKEEKEQKEKEERERLIREEWELLQKKEKEAKEKRERQRQQKEERLQEALTTENRPAVEKPTHNPLAPDGYTEPNERNYGTEKDSKNCPFFLKTGACRFGDSCSRRHPHPASSTTLLIPAMYSSLGLTEWGMGDRDDSALEYEEGDMYKQFRSFYEDVFPEFACVGKVVQFKVSCNYEPHLRGSVYVQYQRSLTVAGMHRGSSRVSSVPFSDGGTPYVVRDTVPFPDVCTIRRDARKENTAIFCMCSGIPVEPFPEPIAISLASLLSPPPSSRRSSRHDRSERTRSRSRSRERHRRFEITHLALSEVYLSLSLVEGVQEMGVSTIVITEEGVDHEREGVPTAVKADAIHDLPAGRSPTGLVHLGTWRRERRKRERQSSESEKDEVRDSAIESNRLDTEISVNISTAEGEERAAKHKSKKKRKKRSVESVSPSSSKRRHHKKRKHKGRGSDSREPEEGKFDREGTVENPTHEGEEEEKNFKVAKSAPEAVGNCGNKNIATDKGSPDSGTPNSDPSHAKPVPQGSPVA
ncbi:U2 small nuclear ribonucleoprotein auxiliary factor 35 kDa subunit-related protein 1 [Geodia barretti]|uniref:U2 small nuclear ribonucleoprotein auxiliary factor 35 kDa subunit-related protein 1 n=1 Tax=Geodia barretti TaxID=519541 RepID=A0AA35WM30_GEOBA|nr:U2 small nuclear ribonucleoprotein auxiliary factor 35 kDa subunit-related protein 1 [Geodia barretti]